MPIRPIVQLGDPRLRETASPVKDPSLPEVSVLVRDLADTLAHWRTRTGFGRGIAAPQLGVGLRVIFLQLHGAEAWPLVNPEIIERSAEKIVVWDACLSFFQSLCKWNGTAQSLSVIKILAPSGMRFRQATTRIYRSFSNMKLTTSMAFSPSTGSLT